MSTFGTELLVAGIIGLFTRRFPVQGKHSNFAALTLILASVAILAYWQPLGLCITLLLTAFTWLMLAMSRAAEAGQRSRWINIGVTVPIFALVVGKYTP